MNTWVELPDSEEDEFAEEPSDLKRARVVRRRRRARRLGQSLQSAIAVATHHLRAPLTSTLANLDIMEDAALGGLTDAQLTHLRFAREGLLELERTVGDLLALARLREEQVPVECCEIDVAALVGEVTSRMGPRARQVGVRLGSTIRDKSCCVATDKKYLGYLLTELAENAVRYCGDCGTVTLTVQRNERRGVRVEVLDNGPGIPEADAVRVFDLFYQRPTHTGHQARGTGIGLAIVKRLAELLQARISLRHPVEGGCAFAVDLPARLFPRR